MFDDQQYELIDFGNGRKLERFGTHLLDRPCPAAERLSVAIPEAWRDASARFRRDHGRMGTDRLDKLAWHPPAATISPWQIQHGSSCFELRLTPFGHVGLFAEQAGNWDWITWQVARGSNSKRILNLFAYTGGSTLAAAAAGAEVTHVDAARNVVVWARTNAAHSGLAHAPIRWIAEDASRFVERECRRGNTYHGIILDPPSYGHGPKGEPWKIERDLPILLRNCAKLLPHEDSFILLTCHSDGYTPAELEATVADAVVGSCQAGVVAKPMYLRTRDGRRLPAGAVARWATGGGRPPLP